MCHSPILAITKLKLKINPKGRSLPETRSSQSCYSSEMESWDFSADLLSQQSLCKQKIKENVDKLGHLADKCERVNSNLVKVVAESHRILDNPFLASQAHLTDHVTNLNYDACLDIGAAIDTYSQYVEAVQELVDAQDEICINMLQRLETMNTKAQIMFRKATESKYHLCGNSDSDNTDGETSTATSTSDFAVSSEDLEDC